MTIFGLNVEAVSAETSQHECYLG